MHSKLHLIFFNSQFRHGIGHALNVHEGPFSIGSRFSDNDPGLEPYMFTSNGITRNLSSTLSLHRQRSMLNLCRARILPRRGLWNSAGEYYHGSQRHTASQFPKQRVLRI